MADRAIETPTEAGAEGRNTFDGKQLARLREGKRLSQGQLASRLGVDRMTVQAWETGRAEPRFDHAVKLAQFFGLSIDTFVAPEARADH